ncbi:AraC family transcriptional regulator [Tateyamaria omphalii]|uniref:GlxA family transcriptional regulator n=1 Tax=Tateyamaria omphalii TaxID=299262 RepID=UPI001676AEB4|nr:helix-turn-helix domain-containing protein [Tateyamaria omphalii]GGX67741.1 AraC family transcriptional regulator [Tateyamaria omphalii]
MKDTAPPHHDIDDRAGIGQLDGADGRPRTIEIHVSRGFSGLELTSVTHVLSTANMLLGHDLFSWRFSTDAPGIVTGDQGALVRAEPAIGDHRLADIMVVVGGKQAAAGNWLARARAMQRKARTVVLLSDAATGYIKATRAPAGRVTTHWRDVTALVETGYHPKLTTHLSENSDGIITAAGAGATLELMVGLVAPYLTGPQVAELGSHLLLQTIRKSDAEQPKCIADNEGLFDARLTEVIRLMENTVNEPLSMDEITARVGVSTRHLERVFRTTFNDTPARFYKRLRVKRARTMIEESLLPMIDIAVACGFGSCTTMSKAVKGEYGVTPSRMRARKDIQLLTYGGR